ncbi:hypothetical protein LGQ02_09065 [Bacillus shivajii]|uniref:hypothetical protein n=1 Tax=Bacillus shivajii TaxID=1983719 RepID=UPI001CFBD55C|nr:hypothetical protein [Bacillus shivajii]UCZ54873.1 hypothetical protein LGQ02_09065 [Bacillus shivajii]
MDRRKSYRMLAILLFLMFISFIARSFLYFFIALVIAVIIFFLLKKDKQARKRVQDHPQNSESNKVSTPNSTILFSSLFFLGFIMFSYGVTGYLNIETIYDQFGVMVDEWFILIFFSAVGFFLMMTGMTVMIKKWLS